MQLVAMASRRDEKGGREGGRERQVDRQIDTAREREFVVMAWCEKGGRGEFKVRHEALAK